MTRPLFSNTSTPPLAGTAFLAQDNAVKNLLLDGATAPLTNVAVVGGNPNTLSANIRDTYLDGDFVTGQAIRFVYPAAANTGAMTIAITPVDALGAPTGSAVTKNLRRANGQALTADQVMTGLVVEASFAGGAFNITSSILGTSEASRFHWQYVASGTWTKPLGLSPQTPVHILCRAGGGGGLNSTARGGSGGGAALRIITLSALLSSESVIVAAGGAVLANGGNSSFGAHVTAYGGQSGANPGSRGGGMFEIGGAVTDTALTIDDARNHLDGGRGSEGGNRAGRSVWGGGGGGASTSAPLNQGGVSLYSGNGGNTNAAGVAPSGGGGANAAGARGQVDVWI